MKRTVSALVLFAFVLVGAAPCRAAFMSCGMPMPSDDERCASCVTDSGSAPVLKAGTCCSVQLDQDRSTAPAVLSVSSAGPSASAKVMLATIPAPTGALTSAIVSLCVALPCATGPPLSTTRTTVLRL